MSVEQHRMRGTFRKHRHAPAVVTPAMPEPQRSPKPPRGLLATLGPAGRRFVRDAWQDYEFNASEAHVLRLAASCLDAEAAARDAGNVPAATAARRQFLNGADADRFPARRPTVMMRRRTTPATPQLQDLGIQEWLDLVTGTLVAGAPHRHWPVRCACQRSAWPSYRAFLAMYRAVRREWLARRARLPRRARPPFAETLYRMARRWPRRNVEDLGATLWRRRFEDDAT